VSKCKKKPKKKKNTIYVRVKEIERDIDNNSKIKKLY
jgi:hypothetical protein